MSLATPPVVAGESMPAPEADARAALARTWAEPGGFMGWFMNVNHKSIAIRMIVTALAFFGLGGVLALLMRVQLSRPDNHLIGPDLYDQLFTVHGSTMMFLFAVPVMQALGLYVVPLMLGTRNVAFPRLNAFGYYVYLFGGLFLWIAFLLNVGPDVGWFSYVPLAGPQYGVGKRPDVWAQLITFTELAALVAAVETIVTTLKMRAPGMSLHRLPLFVWAMLITSIMVIFAMPAVMVASLFLATDRLVSTQFFNPAEGGDALLWQHLFWFFGHPEVYIIFVPALGMVSTIVITFGRRAVFGYTALVLSLVATAFLGFGLWVHHMFATGLPALGLSFFTAASMMIAIPTGAQIFCWLVTLWGGRLRLATPLYFVLGFVVVFVVGGLTGVMLASGPLDLQVHDTYFVVAHLHYVLIGGAIFPLFGALHYWFPKLTGRMLSERAGKVSFWLLFAGFNLAFFPMHQLGLQGMPRRVYTYLPESGWATLNQISTLGVLVLTLGVLLFVLNAVVSMRAGALAGDNPWGADTLEWSTTSPPPMYNYVHLPTVNSRHPLWTRTAADPVVTGLRTDVREVLITDAMDARPDHRQDLDGPTVWPFLAAISATIVFVGVVFTPWAVVVGALPVLIALTAWFWSHREIPPPAPAKRPPVTS
jgi:cytochrome c oxidase subunit I+III